MSDRKIRIRRAKHDEENPYFLTSRATAQDKSITYSALGLLIYVLSKPDDWIVQPRDLEREGCGSNQVYKILKELIEKGYMERVYHRDLRGRVEWVEYIAHEIIEPIRIKPLDENHKVENPKVGNHDITVLKKIPNKRENKKPSSPKKKLTEREFWLEAFRAVQPLVEALLKATEPTFDPNFMSAEQYLTVYDLKKYVPAAEELARLGCAPAEIEAVKQHISQKYIENGWKIAASSIARNYMVWRGAALKAVSVSPVGGNSKVKQIAEIQPPLTDEELKALADERRAIREGILP